MENDRNTKRNINEKDRKGRSDIKAREEMWK
jgi:hypothetical protein